MPVEVVVEEELLVEIDERVGAAAHRRGLGDVPLGDHAAEAEQVIPHDLQAVLGNREGDAADGALDGRAVALRAWRAWR